MDCLKMEIEAFAARKHAEQRHASRTVAFFLATGVDLEAALRGDSRARTRTAAQLSRLLERERLRGLARHWSYDLNRHIALKEALNELVGQAQARPARREPRRSRQLRNRKAAPKGAAVDTRSFEAEG